MLNIKVRITPDNRTFKLNYSGEFNFPIKVNWGDGTSKIVKRFADFKHAYPKEEKIYEIIAEDFESRDVLRFDKNSNIISLKGFVKLNENSYIGFLRDSEILSEISLKMKTYNENQPYPKNLTDFCKGCKSLIFDKNSIDVSNLLAIKMLDRGFEGCWNLDTRSIRDILHRIPNCISMNGTFSNLMIRDYEGITFEFIRDLISADSIFENNFLARGGLPYMFSLNTNLKNLRSAFKGNTNLNVDNNWYYYLPPSVETKVEDIFDMKING